METWTITAAPAPADLDDPEAWALHGMAAASHAVDDALWGHTDTAFAARYLLARLGEQTYARRTFLVATPAGGLGDPDAVVGFASVIMPNQGNDHAGFVDVAVHPDHRGAGVGAALLAEGERLVRDAGRGTVIATSEHRGEPEPDDPDALVAPTGSGRIRSTDPGARFAIAHGYTLGQAERYSMLELPVDTAHVAELRAEAADRAGSDYRLVRWRDRAPQEHVEGLALLETRMSTDAPSGEVDFREDVWDVERVRDHERRIAEANHGFLVVAAQHVVSGELAGFTMVEYVLDEDEPVFQEDTIVLSEHRGHRLGMLLKADMLQWLAAERPGARRVHTWNAEENAYMLGINVALGFRPVGVAGMWQKVTPADAVMG